MTPDKPSSLVLLLHWNQLFAFLGLHCPPHASGEFSQKASSLSVNVRMNRELLIGLLVKIAWFQLAGEVGPCKFSAQP